MAITINGSGTLTGVSVGGLPDGIVDTDMLATDAVTAAKIGSLPAGSILQVIQAVKTDKFSTTNSGRTTFTDITDLSASITPASTSNKVLIRASVQGSGSQYGSLVGFRLMRGSTAIALGDTETNFEPATLNNVRAVGDNNGCFHATLEFLDSPSDDTAITYKLQGQVESGGFFINRTYSNTANVNFSLNGISTFTLMEIAG